MASVDLSSSVIDLEGVRDDAAAALVACLESRPGRKALVLDPHVGPTVMRLATMATLRAHDVDRLYYLEGGTLETTCAEVMFVVRPRLELMHKLAEVVASVRDDVEAERANRADARRKGDDEGDDVRVTFTACFVPRRSEACEAVLEHLGVLRHLKLKALPIDLVPFEKDAALVERKHAWRDLAVERDVSSLYDVARALHELQRRVGEVPIVQGKGAASKEVAEIMERMRREQAIEDARARAEWPRDARGTRRAKARPAPGSTPTRPASSSSSPSSSSPRRRARGPHRLRGHPSARASSGTSLPRGAGAGARRNRGGNADRNVAGARRGRPAWLTNGVIDGSPRSIETDRRIDMIVLIDRDVDMVTPLCTQTTYEGLLDEVLGISATGTVAPERGGDGGGPRPGPGPAPTPTRTRHGTNARKRKRSAPAWTRRRALRRAARLNSARVRDAPRQVLRDAERVPPMESDARAMSPPIGGFVRDARRRVAGRRLGVAHRAAERAPDSTRDAHFRRVRFAEVLDTERLCLATPRSSKPRCRACRRACRTAIGAHGRRDGVRARRGDGVPAKTCARGSAFGAAADARRDPPIEVRRAAPRDGARLGRVRPPRAWRRRASRLPARTKGFGDGAER